MIARRAVLAMLLAGALTPRVAGAATVAGTVFDDRNGDGALRAGEPGLAGWVVFVDTDGDGALGNPDGAGLCSAAAGEPCDETDATGAFAIAGLPAGSHQLRTVLQSGWRLISAAAIDVLLLSDEAVESDLRFGVFQLGRVAGSVFVDANGNAARDGGEPALAGWTAFDDADLDGGLDAGEVAAHSAGDGAYQLDGFALGTHSVRLRRRCGFASSLPPPPGRYALSITTSGQRIAGRDFGVQPPAALPGDGNGDRVVTAADLVAVAGAIGTSPQGGADADGDGTVSAADLPVVAANAFDCAGLSAAPPAATPTATGTTAGPTATASAPPPPTATVSPPPAASATNTATRTASAPPTATATATRTATATALATATSTPTASRTATNGPSAPPGEALAGIAVQVVNGMSAIPAVITALVSGIEFGALVFDPGGQTSGLGGPAGACPLGGSATRSCSGVGQVTLGFAFDSCRVPTASGSVVIDELPPATAAVSLSGTGFCPAVLPPWSATVGVSALFRDPQGGLLLATSAELTGSISPTLGGSCQASAASLMLTGTVRSQFSDGSAVALTFANTAVVVTVMQFNADCVPIRYRMTFDGPGAVTVEPAAALTSGTAGGVATAVVFDGFVVDQDASGTPTQTFLDGDIDVACAGATLSFDTTQLLAQAVGQPCPQQGILRITAGGAITNLIYHPAGQVGIDSDDDGFADSDLDSCQEAPPLCGGAPTATATRTRTATPAATASVTATRTASGAATATASATGAATPTASTTPPLPLSATATGTPTATPPPTATATGSVAQELCDTLPGPALIPDANVAGIDNDIVVGAAQTIADLNVFLSLAHTWVGDLRVVLTHLDTGSSVVLLEHPGHPATMNGCGLDDLEAVFDDAALRPAEDRCAEGPPFAAIDGSVAALGALSIFNGQNLAGTWRLNVSDRATQDAGALLGWCLRPNSQAPVVTAFTCAGDQTECVQVIDEPFTLDFRYADPDGDAATWHLTGRRGDGVEFDAGSGTVDAGSGGLMTLDFTPFVCPTLDCPDTTFDYLLTVRDAAGRQSPAQRLRLIVTLFEL